MMNQSVEKVKLVGELVFGFVDTSFPKWLLNIPLTMKCMFKKDKIGLVNFLHLLIYILLKSWDLKLA